MTCTQAEFLFLGLELKHGSTKLVIEQRLDHCLGHHPGVEARVRADAVDELGSNCAGVLSDVFELNACHPGTIYTADSEGHLWTALIGHGNDISVHLVHCTVINIPEDAHWNAARPDRRCIHAQEKSIPGLLYCVINLGLLGC
jgi:hypothetical protein